VLFPLRLARDFEPCLPAIARTLSQPVAPNDTKDCWIMKFGALHSDFIAPRKVVRERLLSA
jgi:hypothetical protein